MRNPCSMKARDATGCMAAVPPDQIVIHVLLALHPCLLHRWPHILDDEVPDKQLPSPPSAASPHHPRGWKRGAR